MVRSSFCASLRNERSATSFGETSRSVLRSFSVRQSPATIPFRHTPVIVKKTSFSSSSIKPARKVVRCSICHRPPRRVGVIVEMSALRRYLAPKSRRYFHQATTGNTQPFLLPTTYRSCFGPAWRLPRLRLKWTDGEEDRVENSLPLLHDGTSNIHLHHPRCFLPGRM